MKIEKWNSYYLLGFFVAFVSLLFYTAHGLSISYKEAVIFFDDYSLLNIIIKASTSIFGQNDIALRLPFIIFYILSNIIIYEINKIIFKKEIDRFYTQLLFMVLPGLISASLLVNNAIIVIFCTLLYIYIYLIQKRHCYLLLLIFLFIDNSFAILFLAIFFHSLVNKENKFIIFYSIILFALSMNIYGFEIGGKPKGYFLDTFAIYSSIFSPIIFLYFLYTMYRVGIKREKDLIWFISVTALFLSLLFSFRQKIYIEDFAPFAIIAIPHMVKLFLHSFRVRLPKFRKYHYFFLKSSFLFLVLSIILILFSKPFYLFIEKPQKHFAYKYHFVDEIAYKLKKENINNIYCDDEKLLKRLEFYGIKRGEEYFLSLKEKKENNFSIKLFNRDILNIYYEKKL